MRLPAASSARMRTGLCHSTFSRLIQQSALAAWVVLLVSGSCSGESHRERLLKAAESQSVSAAMMNDAWNAGDGETRACVLEVWIKYPSARDWMPDPAVISHDPDWRVRAVAVKVLPLLVEGGPALEEMLEFEALRAARSAPLWMVSPGLGATLVFSEGR